MEYLDFEKPIQEIQDQYINCILIERKSGVDMKEVCNQLQSKLEKTIKELHSQLTPWQRVQLSRHPNRPYALDYILSITNKESFIELHGDRNVGDDKAMIGGFGKIEDITFMFIGTQKGKNTKERQYRRFGMPNPEGYRKALRLMKLAEKFSKPIVSFIDTPGAFPGIEAEKRGQGEAIGRNIYEMMCLKVPIIVLIIGEGASGGALGIGIGDKVSMMENSWYSVISPESCSTILWGNWKEKEKSADSLKLTAEDMYKLNLIDDVIKEPLGGAHFCPEKAYEIVKKKIIKYYKELSLIDIEELIRARKNKYIAIGCFND
ncbi:MAG: acetyl-CoA carboxylase carboxyltransferase subunit alpha [Flavobacteriales bacterium]|jgi:acetyl-CoA carboxylase carboxyl transferase subunit alpha|uniref:acetyl-CoA carboxylase carboxyltransferase subunit alpha n=1 Tax=Blattabacterium sp. (Mastotermes darwiniensis) TaxID=39768 RepID=UPI000231DEB9|nr:acetyl-CoA carboxylase carboxyltransferase subunit alpha [Blattabacterium sp. (Mastotermes darwiniensis)]AER40749.1 acetyl-CoA carboxylase, carboxyl transferase subunit alpha [Blattabacterium sp. (Mastotermes darwiniensis) str. MADAR]MDR1805132.1 acetyl-CoA carboxylase carboxyltransferase subunit alpha [Flavobacteriales bacterium]